MFCGVLTGCHSGSSGHINVILITVDTLRADKLSIYGSEVFTPAIDSLAGEGILYEKAFCQVPITLPSHATILTGAYPYRHGIKHNGKFKLAPEATTLAEILKLQGYHTAAIIGAYVLDRKYGLSQGFDTYDDEMPGEAYKGSSMYVSRRAGEITGRAVRWLEENQEPFFMWLHYFDPHSPYDPPMPFKSRYDNQYDGEVAYVDAEVGKLLNAVREGGLEQRTLIVFTSDHGESLGEHGELTHALFLYGSTVRVPLILTLPGIIQSGLRDTSVVQLVDVMPTILSILGLESPSECEGRDLLGLSPGEEGVLEGFAYSETWAPKLQYGWSELQSLRSDKYLFVRAPTPELYDLSQDPDELTNIYEENFGGLEHFTSILDSLQKSGERPGMSEDLGMDEVDLDALERLGYVFKTQPASTGEKDPKDMIKFHRDIISAFNFLNEGKYETALNMLKETASRDESDPVIHRGIGLCYGAIGEDSLALTYLGRAIDLDPMEERSYYAASSILERMGRLGEAAEMLEILVKRYPRDPLSRVRLAEVYSRSGSVEKAWETYIAAIELDRADYRLYRDFGDFLIQRGRYEESLKVLERAVKLNPACSEAHSWMGFSYARLGEWEKAANSFWASIEADSGSKESWVDYGKVLRKLGEVEEARRAFETALSIDPDFAPAKLELERMEDSISK
jgi:arylsulfatase A-like enzyme/Tfp pilus assembly protein PilF